jgi:hypothetical protein
MHFFSICRTIILVFSIVTMANAAFAQNSVGIGTATPAASAQLDVVSTTKGMLVPRVTTVQMNAIASPATGLLVYNTDSAAFAYRNAGAWVYLIGNATAASGWSTQGNAGTNPASNFIGTTDDQPVVVRQNNQRAGLLASSNTSWGVNALNPASTGFSNTAIGVRALRSNTTGSNNTANGLNALRNNTTGNNNTAHGLNALSSNTTGLNNTANGVSALGNNTTGSSNTANGADALFSNTTGFSNVAVGVQALFSNTTRSNLVAVGDSALYNNGEGATESFQATGNIAVGSKALFANTTGYDNTANGSAALRSNTTGSFNTANGAAALFNNTIGNSNTANGASALFSNTQGNSNTAFGAAAGRNNQTGSRNVFIGNQAGFNETGSNKLYISNNAANALLYGEFDTDKLQVNNMLGIGMLPLTVAGANEYAQLQIKQQSSQSGIGITRANNNDRWELYVANSNSNFELYYNNALRGSFATANGAYTQASDRRLKKDISRYEPVLNKVAQLEAFSYHYVDNDSNAPLSIGFMAQDVQKLFPEAVSEMDMKNGEKMLGINYQYFTVAAIKGLQEQQVKIETLEAEMAAQKEKMAQLEALIKTIMEKK